MTFDFTASPSEILLCEALSKLDNAIGETSSNVERWKLMDSTLSVLENTRSLFKPPSRYGRPSPAMQLMRVLFAKSVILHVKPDDKNKTFIDLKRAKNIYNMEIKALIKNFPSIAADVIEDRERFNSIRSDVEEALRKNVPFLKRLLDGIKLKQKDMSSKPSC